MYFVHSFRATPTPQNDEWALATSSYGKDFVSVVQRGNISATQFHPEKSGAAGLDVLRSFLEGDQPQEYVSPLSNGRWHRVHLDLSSLLVVAEHQIPISSKCVLCQPGSTPTCRHSMMHICTLAIAWGIAQDDCLPA